MLIEKADMLDAFVRNMLALGLFDAVDPPEDAKTMLAYVAGWIDMLDVMIREEEKKRDEKKALRAKRHRETFSYSGGSRWRGKSSHLGKGYVHCAYYTRRRRCGGKTRKMAG